MSRLADLFPEEMIFDRDGKRLYRPPALDEDQKLSLLSGHFRVTRIKGDERGPVWAAYNVPTPLLDKPLALEEVCQKCKEPWGAWGCPTVMLLRMVEESDADLDARTADLRATREKLGEYVVREEWFLDERTRTLDVSLKMAVDAVAVGGIEVVEIQLHKVARQIEARLWPKGSGGTPIDAVVMESDGARSKTGENDGR